MSRPFESFIEPLRSDIENYCEFVSLISETDDETLIHFNNLKNKMDCIVFSGQTYHHVLMNKIGKPDIPCYAIDDSRCDITEIFLNLLLENRNFDFSRVFIDFAFPENDFIGIKNLLPKEQWPYFNDSLSSDFSQLVTKTFENHLYLHRTGKIDLSITRFGTMVPKLNERGYRNIYAYPPKEYFFNFLMQIVNSFRQKIDEDNLPSYVSINFEETNTIDTSNILNKIKTYFDNLSTTNGYNFVYQTGESSINVLTYNSELNHMTQSFKNINIFNMLLKECPSIKIIGLGTGNNIYSARENAKKATQYASSHPDEIYFINQKNILYGPLSSSNTIILNGKPNEKILNLSEKFGINHINIQKIITLTDLLQSTMVSGSQLANHLGITIRSANRLLKQIEEFGGATSHTEKINEGRGRPTKYYDLFFVNEID